MNDNTPRQDVNPDHLAEIRREAFKRFVAECKRRIANAPKPQPKQATR